MSIIDVLARDGDAPFCLEGDNGGGRAVVALRLRRGVRGDWMCVSAMETTSGFKTGRVDVL